MLRDRLNEMGRYEKRERDGWMDEGFLHHEMHSKAMTKTNGLRPKSCTTLLHSRRKTVHQRSSMSEFSIGEKYPDGVLLLARFCSMRPMDTMRIKNPIMQLYWCGRAQTKKSDALCGTKCINSDSRSVCTEALNCKL